MVKWKISKKEKDKYIRLQNMTDILIHKEYILRTVKEDARKNLEEWFKNCESEKIFKCTGNFWIFNPIGMALVRQTFPALIANKIVGVQPMSQPVGLAYAMRIIQNEDEDEENDKV